MNPPTTRPKALIRYSPRPISAYVKSNGTQTWGPATSPFLKPQAAWNLAYLSHDFEVSLLHYDPHFTVNVRRTIQQKLDGSGTDIADSEAPIKRVEHLFLLPAPRAVHLLMQSPIVYELPMYQLYGDEWIRTIHKRSFLCQADESPPDNVVDLSEARALIERVK